MNLRFLTKLFSLCLIITTSINLYAQDNGFHSNTERGQLNSLVLGMKKSYQVFLPESYNYSTESSYPVVFIIDGDYNFLYITGMIESFSNVSEKIPEMIVVAISDNGNEGYKKDCSLKTETNPNGNASNFIKYLETELKPEIRKKYRVSSFEVLIGHSLGGLFSTTTFLTQQNAFNAYIAIDPSYWWDNEYIVSLADSLLANGLEINSELFITLADTRQMGVHPFVAALEKHQVGSSKWSFHYYPEEDHGSVGVVSVKDGLLHIFKDFHLDRETFYSFTSATELMGHYQSLGAKYESKLRLPPLLLGNMLYYYFRSEKYEEIKVIEETIKKDFPASLDDFYSTIAKYYLEIEEFSKAEDILNKSISSNNNAYKSYDILSKLYYAQNKFYKAEEMALKSIDLGKQLHIRQWQLNELESNLVKIQLEFKN